MYLCEPERTLLLDWGLEFWSRWLCLLYVAREKQAFPRGRSLCSSSLLKTGTASYSITVKYKSWPWRGTTPDPVTPSAGSTELHRAVPLADGIDFLQAHRLDGKVSSHSHKWMLWYMGVDFPEAEEGTKPGFWNTGCRMCAPVSCSGWVPMWDQIPHWFVLQMFWENPEHSPSSS